MNIMNSASFRPLSPSRPTAGGNLVAAVKTELAPSSLAVRATAKQAPESDSEPETDGRLDHLKAWITVKGAELGGGLGLVAGGFAVIGLPVGGLMAAGVLAAAAVGAAIGGFAGSQLADLGEYESGRIALEHGRPH